MNSLKIKDKWRNALFFMRLSIFLLIYLSLINLCRAGQLPEKNEPVIREKQQVLDKEEAEFLALLKSLNIDCGSLKSDDSTADADLLNKKRYSKANKSSPVHKKLKHSEQTKNRQIRAYYQLGYQYYEKGDYISAIAQFELILKHAPREKDVYYNLGCLYVKVGRYEDAIKAYNLALKLYKGQDDGQIYYNLALIYDKNLKDREKSGQYYKKYLDNPDIIEKTQ
ncbi:MAG: tetratricopeptide repeat protein [Candidatus Omnitrophica bacterium]|nr:tetratricopeptide repeat protein [Candidatus Omnitrophota bacterium]